MFNLSDCIINFYEICYWYSTLTRGPGQLLPCDSDPVLQYGSGPSSDFLAKILGVDTPLFLWKTQFYFLLSSLLLDTLAFSHCQ
jgi:hypothetical protein